MEPTFVGKAQVFPGAKFVVGFDTAIRITQPRYYGHSKKQMRHDLNTMYDNGCRFLVAGRTDKTGRFQDAGELPKTPNLPDIFIPIPGTNSAATSHPPSYAKQANAAVANVLSGKALHLQQPTVYHYAARYSRRPTISSNTSNPPRQNSGLEISIPASARISTGPPSHQQPKFGGSVA